MPPTPREKTSRHLALHAKCLTQWRQAVTNRSEGRLADFGSLSRGFWDASWTVVAALLQVCGASWGVLGASSEAARRYIPILKVLHTFF